MQKENDEPINNLHSLSSSSVESFDSHDGEGNLFEQCIKSGLPKQKSPKKSAARSLNKTFQEHLSSKDKNKYRTKKANSSQIPTLKSFRKDNDVLDSQDDLNLFQECIYSGMPKHKAVSGHNADDKVCKYYLY